MTDSERVIDDDHTRPSTIKLEKLKDQMKDQMEYFFNERTWPYQGTSPDALKMRTSVLNKILARTHIRQIWLR